MERLEQYPWMQRVKFLHAPLQILLCGGLWVFNITFLHILKYLFLIKYTYLAWSSWLQLLALFSRKDGNTTSMRFFSIDSELLFLISSLDVETLARFEPEQYAKLQKMVGEGNALPNKVYFNKGLWSVSSAVFSYLITSNLVAYLPIKTLWWRAVNAVVTYSMNYIKTNLVINVFKTRQRYLRTNRWIIQYIFSWSIQSL